MMEYKVLVDISETTAANLYRTICKHMSFDNVVELYKLLNYKMTNLDDAPDCEVTYYRSEE